MTSVNTHLMEIVAQQRTTAAAALSRAACHRNAEL